jgi:hypothetical protein
VLSLNSFYQSLVIEVLSTIVDVLGGNKGDEFLMSLLQLLAQFVFNLTP